MTIQSPKDVHTTTAASSTSSSSSSPKTCQVLSRTPLRYDAGADANSDRPAHVRAGSGCAFVDIPTVGRRLCVVQDDANFIAVVDVAAKNAAGVAVDSIDLPAQHGLRQFDKLRGNKADKLDLESACAVVVDGKPGLLAMGSGSTDARMLFVLTTFGPDGTPSVEPLPANAFFKRLQNNNDFAGDELNVEGMVVDGDRVRFFNRGNGAGDAVDAVGEVSLRALLAHLRDPLASAPPPLVNLRAFELGTIDGTRLTFTDAARGKDGRTLFLCAAEASPNTYDDGVVKGTAIGVLDDDGRVAVTLLRDESGRVLKDKVEGLALDPSDPKRAYIVVDKDSPTEASELLTIRLP
jgi:hypothetical protein